MTLFNTDSEALQQSTSASNHSTIPTLREIHTPQQPQGSSGKYLSSHCGAVVAIYHTSVKVGP